MDHLRFGRVTEMGEEKIEEAGHGGSGLRQGWAVGGAERGLRQRSDLGAIGRV